MRHRRITCLNCLKNNILGIYGSGTWRKLHYENGSWATIGETGEKSKFSLQQLPHKGHFLKEKANSLRKCTIFFFACGENKKFKKNFAPSALYSSTRPGATVYLSHYT